MLNYDLTEAGEDRRLQLSKLEEIRAEAYERKLSCFMTNKFLRKCLPQE